MAVSLISSRQVVKNLVASIIWAAIFTPPMLAAISQAYTLESTYHGSIAFDYEEHAREFGDRLRSDADSLRIAVDDAHIGYNDQVVTWRILSYGAPFPWGYRATSFCPEGILTATVTLVCLFLVSFYHSRLENLLRSKP